MDLTQFTGAACLLFSGSRLVMEVRKPHKWQRTPGQPVEVGIGCVGGTIEEGESPVQALHREAMEEISCAVTLRSARATADVTPAGTIIQPGIEIEGFTPAMVWDGDPQPGDLPAIVLAEPEAVFAADFVTLPIGQIRNGVEIRERVTLPDDGRFVHANTLSHIRRLRQQEPELAAEVRIGCA